MSQTFQKTVENFMCEHCGASVKGNGFTNHCPNCLWSKHVDIHPGDRQAACGGMMEPVEVTFKAGEYSVLHRCQKCGFERTNKLAKDDNFNVAVALSAKAKK